MSFSIAESTSSGVPLLWTLLLFVVVALTAAAGSTQLSFKGLFCVTQKPSEVYAVTNPEPAFFCTAPDHSSLSPHEHCAEMSERGIPLRLFCRAAPLHPALLQRCPPI